MRTMLLYIAMLGCIFIASGIAISDPTESLSSNKSAAEISHLIKIGGILNNSEKYNGEMVTIEGTYLGWTGRWTGPHSAALLTRSDWGIEDETGGISVSGLAPGTTPELDPLNGVGTRLIVSGIVTLIPEGPVLLAKIVTLTNATIAQSKL